MNENEKLGMRMLQAVSDNWEGILTGREKAVLTCILKNSYLQGMTVCQVSQRQMQFGDDKLGIYGCGLVHGSTSQAMKGLRLLGVVNVIQCDFAPPGVKRLPWIIEPVADKIMALGSVEARERARTGKVRDARAAARGTVVEEPRILPEDAAEVVKPSRGKRYGNRPLNTYYYQESLLNGQTEKKDTLSHPNPSSVPRDASGGARGKAARGLVRVEVLRQGCGDDGVTPARAFRTESVSPLFFEHESDAATQYARHVLDGRVPVLRGITGPDSPLVQILRVPETVNVDGARETDLTPNPLAEIVDTLAKRRIRKVPTKPAVARAPKPKAAPSREEARERAEATRQKAEEAKRVKTATKAKKPSPRPAWEDAWGRHFGTDRDAPRSAAFWTGQTFGQAAALMALLGDDYADFLDFAFGAWRDLVNVKFGYMKNNPPPAYPTVGFLLAFRDRIDEARSDGRYARRVEEGFWAGDAKATAERAARRRKVTVIEAAESIRGLREEEGTRPNPLDAIRARVRGTV